MTTNAAEAENKIRAVIPPSQATVTRLAVDHDTLALRRLCGKVARFLSDFIESKKIQGALELQFYV